MNKKLDASDVIKPFAEEESEEKEEKKKAPTPFTFIEAVSKTKQDILKEDPDLLRHYNPYVTNRGFGYFPDTVLYANELNMLSNIPPKFQYYYYMQSIRKGKRFSKWHKLQENEDLKLVQEVYQVRTEVAKEYLKILDDIGLDLLRKLRDKGE